MVESGPILADVLPILVDVGPTSDDLGPNFVEPRPFRPQGGRVRPILAEVGPLRATFGRSRPKRRRRWPILGESGVISVELRPSLVKFWAVVGRISSNSCPLLADAGPRLAIFGRCRAALDRMSRVGVAGRAAEHERPGTGFALNVVPLPGRESIWPSSARPAHEQMPESARSSVVQEISVSAHFRVEYQPTPARVEYQCGCSERRRRCAIDAHRVCCSLASAALSSYVERRRRA